MMLFYAVINPLADPANNTTATSNSLSLIGWLAGFLVAAGVVTMVAWPLLNIKTWTRRQAAGPSQLELDALYSRLETEQLALDELEFDHEAGGLTETDYTQLKAKSEIVIQELEQQIQDRPQTEDELAQRYTQVDNSSNEIENGGVAVATRKPAKVTTLTESEILHKRTPVKKSLQCSECGTGFKPGDRFCSRCGAPLPSVCQDCGTELSQEDRFCAKCGATVRK